MSRSIETADSVFGINNLLAGEYALISSLVEEPQVHKASKNEHAIVHLSQILECQATSCKETVSVTAEKSKEQEAESATLQC